MLRAPLCGCCFFFRTSRGCFFNVLPSRGVVLVSAGVLSRCRVLVAPRSLCSARLWLLR